MRVLQHVVVDQFIERVLNLILDSIWTDSSVVQTYLSFWCHTASFLTVQIVYTRLQKVAPISLSFVLGILRFR